MGLCASSWRRGAVKIWRDGELATVIDEIPDERETRFNDVIADPEGRVFCGTMPTPERPGRLYRLDTDGTLHLILDEVGISNGMGFTADQRTMYFTDTPTLNIYRFDYDRLTGDIIEPGGIRTGGGRRRHAGRHDRGRPRLRLVRQMGRTLPCSLHTSRR